ncbi:MAG: hypothetical protein JKY31_00215 [Rhodobacteraceae bacterium]|nr:hypothetical protein [Paracoccaceae bacterium]
MFRPFAMISLLAVPTGVFAQCPTLADMTTGISVLFSSGDTENFRQGESGIIIQNGTDNAERETTWQNHMVNGIFETNFLERTAGTWTPTGDFNLEYDFDIAAVFPLVEGMVGGGIQTLVEPDFVEPATYSYSVHASENVMIGDCEYVAFDFYQTYIMAENGFGVTKSKYLPELGITIIYQSKWPQDDALNREAIDLWVDG